MKKNKKISKLHKKEEKLHEKAEKAMKADEKVHEAMEKAFKAKAKKKASPAKKKIKKVMHEWKEGTLHSGSAKGPRVKSKKQAIAIALSEAKKAKKKK